MSDLSTQLWQWFQDRPKWLQEATRRLLQTGSLKPEDIQEMVVLCKREAGIEVAGYDKAKAQAIPKALFGSGEKKLSLRLDGIGEVSGINALAPRKPLEFLAEPLTVVFGSNGSGKSGYTRILKHACGARGPGILHGNVFKGDNAERSCKLTFTLDGVKADIKWLAAGGVNESLRTISLYDGESAHVYVNNENEVAYEPTLLACFRLLVEACEAVDRALQAEAAAKPSTKPSLPADLQVSASATWFNDLKATTTEAAIQEKCKWTDEDEKSLATLTTRLAETNPADKAKALRKTKGHVSSLKVGLGNRSALVGDEAFATLQKARGDAAAKRKAAGEDAKKVFTNAPLEGIGSESWRLLWEQARAFSEAKAYPEIPFPNVGDGAVCVLCQQSLSPEASGRLTDFESFVKGRLEKEAAAAEKAVKNIIDSIEEIPSEAEIDAKLDLCTISEDDVRTKVKDYCHALRRRRESFLTAQTLVEVTPQPDAGVITLLSNLEAAMESKAVACDEDAKSDQRPKLQAEALELKGRKWVSQQAQAVRDEVVRLKALKLLKDASKLTNTKALSDKKSSLAEELITKAFVERFEHELGLLGAGRIGVTIAKTKTTKGQVWHQIKLKDSKVNVRTSEVLSEGEFRIVSIAAFLADVDISGSVSPFVFDDPISSLDQDFEEATAARLVKLCASRQVIVFTHRLSLLAMLEDAAEKAGVAVRVVALQKESWGTGEPGGPPLPAQNPKKALNSLINDRLPRAKKVWDNDGAAMYAIEAKALCSDIRITVERLVELELLADVVQRFRRPINTMGKIEKLARIKPEDCAFIDEMMTKYSRYEHAQPKEAPVALPEPNDIADDLKMLKAWVDEFSARPIAAPKT